MPNSGKIGVICEYILLSLLFKARQTSILERDGDPLSIPGNEVEQYVEKFQRLEKAGLDLKEFCSRSMNAVIGKTGTCVTVFHLGEAAFSDSATLIRQIIRLLGPGAFVLLDGMLGQVRETDVSRRVLRVPAGSVQS